MYDRGTARIQPVTANKIRRFKVRQVNVVHPASSSQRLGNIVGEALHPSIPQSDEKEEIRQGDTRMCTLPRMKALRAWRRGAKLLFRPAKATKACVQNIISDFQSDIPK